MNVLVTLETSHNNEMLNPLDSAIAFVYQMQLIDADLLNIIPLIPESERTTISVLPPYNPIIKSFKEYMSFSTDLSFITNKEYSPLDEFQYNKFPKKNIGYGFYSLDIINELREMKQKFNPNHPLNIGSNPFCQIFNTYKSIVEGKDRHFGE